MAVTPVQSRVRQSWLPDAVVDVGQPAGHAAALVDDLDEHVRALVRREGVDPQRDAGVVRRIAEGVVREHDERSLTGVVAPVADVDALVGELVARVSGFGPLQPFLDDPAVEEIWINDPSRVFIARNGRHELTNLMLTSAQVQRAGRADAEVERTADRRQPAVRRRDAARGPPAARGAGGDQPRVLARSTSASSCCAPARLARPGRAGQPHARGRRRSWRPRCGPGSTSWSPAAPRRARPRCSTAWPRRSPAASGWSAPRRSSSCASRTPTGCRCRPGSPGWRAPARSGCATWSRRRCGCGRAGSSSARSGPRSASTCCSRSTPGCRACARCTPTAPARRWSRCARCRCWPARTSRRASSCRPWPRRSTSSSTSASTQHGRTPGQRDRRRARAGRERRHRDRADLRARTARELRRAGTACRRASSCFERAGIDVHALLDEARGR